MNHDESWGIDWFYKGSAGRAEKGLEISVVAVVDVKAHQGYTLSVQQTAARTEPQQIDKSTLIVEEKKNKKGRHKSSPTEPVVSERVQGYLNQLKIARQHLPAGVKYLAADSFHRKKFFVDGVRELGLHLVSKTPQSVIYVIFIPENKSLEVLAANMATKLM
jgi:hypothetical protein